MANNFHRSSNLLGADVGSRSLTGLLIAILLVAAWVVWSLTAKITRYETSDSARLEIAGSAYSLDAPLAGTLASSDLTLGKKVLAGQTLLRFVSTAEQLTLDQERAHLRALEPQLAVLRSQLHYEDLGGADEHRVAGISEETARAQYSEAEARAQLATQQADRAARLRAEGILSEADAEKAKSEARSAQHAAESLKLAITRFEPEQQVRDADRAVKQNQIRADLAKLEADIATSNAAIKRLEYEIDRRTIRAPVTGVLVECATLTPGAEIATGQKLGVILPSGKVQVVADFAPAAALGKVHEGQSAVVRLQGFPWAQYGTLRATVSEVASEIRDGKIRVELAVSDSKQTLKVPVQHGLPASVEVAVERTTPAALLLRTAGTMAGGH